jgi:putative transposase
MGYNDRMRGNYTQLYVHCVWATWDRLPLIKPTIAQAIYNTIAYECQQMNCTLMSIGGIEDHVHLLAGFPPVLSISQFIKQIKGSSSHFVTHVIQPNEFFKWQGSYSAFTLSDRDIDAVDYYIKNQVTHHQQKSFIPQWELSEYR